jgi:Zn-dependent peptidase ImmA (M78 family)
MEDIAKVIGLNLEKLKQSKGLTNENIGEIIGVTRVTVAKYLSGEQVIDSARLFRLARAFNISVKSLLTSPEESLSFMFRADNPDENFSEDLASYLNKTLINHYQVLELAGENKVAFLPQEYRIHLNGNKLSEDDLEIIKEVAEKQRKLFGIEEGFDHDIYSIFENNNINVIALRLSNSKIDALSAYSEDKGAFIIINDDPEIPEERKIFSAVHELGHLIFHRDDYSKEPGELAYTKSRKNINEKMANTFASYFLIPRDQLKSYRKPFIRFVNSFGDLFKIKQKFGVSALALINALREENYIDGQNYGYLSKRLVNAGYQEKEPHPIPNIEKNQKMFSILRKLYFEEKITTNKVAELLSLKDKEARLLVKGWAEDYGDGYPDRICSPEHP